MLRRLLLIRSLVIIALFAPIAATAMSWGFRMHAKGGLSGPLRFEFRNEADEKNIKVEEFTVSERTADHRWKPVWTLSPKRGLTAVEYGVRSSDLDESTPAKKLVRGRVYAAFASARGGGSAMMVFRFNKDGKMTFPESLD